MIVVTGAAGQLGFAFRAVLGDRAEYWERTHLDLARIGDIGPALRSAMPSLVINCAAYTAVDAAESDADTARLVNAVAVGELAAACAEVDARFVTFSTDYVFDGTKVAPYVESDEPRPLNVYGATKLEGERLALAAHPAPLVIRSSWVMSGTHRSFASTMVDLISRGGAVRVVDDQRGTPTFADDLAPAATAAIDRGAGGVLHLANTGEATWFDIASEIATLLGADPGIVQPCTTEEFPRPAPRPKHSALGSERRRELGIPELPDWREGLRRAVARLRVP